MRDLVGEEEEQEEGDPLKGRGVAVEREGEGMGDLVEAGGG